MRVAGLVVASVLALAASAHAGSISGTGGDPTTDPALAGATVLTFDAETLGSFSSQTFGGVTFTGLGDVLRVDASFAGLYNSRGAAYLDNNAGGAFGWLIDFSSPTTAFGFLWGAADDAWTLTAFDGVGGTGNVVDTFVLPATGSSNAGEFYGLTGAGILSATLIDGGSGDWVFVDSFAFSTLSTPEPSSIAFVGLGVLGLGAMVGRRRRSAARKSA